VNNPHDEEKEDNEEEELEAARNYLKRLLKYRPRTEQEVWERMEEKDYSPDVIEETVNWGIKGDLIDDRLFAEYFIEDRLENKPKGRSGLYKELLEHGVESDLANDVLDEKVSVEDEQERCRKLAEKRLSSYRGDDVKAKYRKTLGFLQRRGFSKGMAGSILKELLFKND
jgi:regulatory protein